MDQRAKDLITQGDKLFGKRATLESFWQECADNFYVERADFTRTRTLGEDMAGHLHSSYPLMIRRDLQNLVGVMLRPTNQNWFAIRAQREDKEIQNEKIYLEWARDTMYRAMYDRKSQFVRASKEGDGDFVTFGQAVKQVTLNRHKNGLLYRSWHLRDTVWADDYEGTINNVHRKWNPTACNLAEQFRDKIADELARDLAKPDYDKYTEIKCRHVVVPADSYDSPSYSATKRKWRHPYISLYIDVEHEHVLEEVNVPTLGGYVIPRWVTVSGGWQYAFSPAVVCALPDARLIQAMTRTLQDAGEKAVYPPMIAVENVFRGDMNAYAGGMSWIDQKYAGKLDQAFKHMTPEMEGLDVGLKLTMDVRMMLDRAFYLNKLDLPQRGPEMTAFEVNQRVQEYIRNAAPLFEPIEYEDNAAMCEETFNLMLRNGGFGRPENIPESLRGQEIQFHFVSPITQALGTDKLAKYQEAQQLIGAAMQVDPGMAAEVNARDMLRDTLDGIGVPAKWVRPDREAVEIRKQIAQDQSAAAQQNQIERGAEVAKKGADAVTSLKAALATPGEGVTQQAA